jgi:hypothetical protein
LAQRRPDRRNAAIPLNKRHRLEARPEITPGGVALAMTLAVKGKRKPKGSRE